LLLVGDQQELTEELNKHGAKVGERLEIQHASQVVAMDELPSVALRSKKDSSMRVAINQVKEGNAQACVSAGNTGALMATARFVLKMLPGIDRPAICTALPTMKGHTHMLDLGANIDSNADALFQFAMMGSILASAIDNIEKPTVGLLNIGEEEIKGSEYIKDAARMIEQSDMNYHGFVEGDDIYKGTTDVVVCDGFVGNVALKTSEGVARMVKQFLKEAFLSGLRGKIAALLAKPVLKAFASRIDPGKYNGASLVGLQGIVVKSHGGADARAFANAIRVAIKEVDKQVPQRIAKELGAMVEKRQAI
jgi:glycerol-3-phosphate acyltransferase PlsX